MWNQFSKWQCIRKFHENIIFLLESRLYLIEITLGWYFSINTKKTTKNSLIFWDKSGSKPIEPNITCFLLKFHKNTARNGQVKKRFIGVERDRFHNTSRYKLKPTLTTIFEPIRTDSHRCTFISICLSSIICFYNMCKSVWSYMNQYSWYKG